MSCRPANTVDRNPIICDDVVPCPREIIHHGRVAEELIHTIMGETVMSEIVTEKEREIDKRETVGRKTEIKIQSDETVAEGKASSHENRVRRQRSPSTNVTVRSPCDP
jgi:hypothetical protein